MEITANVKSSNMHFTQGIIEQLIELNLRGWNSKGKCKRVLSASWFYST